jgi:hypothetical protein
MQLLTTALFIWTNLYLFLMAHWTFKPRMLLFFVGRGAMNPLQYCQRRFEPPPRHWQRRNEPSAMMPVAMLGTVQIHMASSSKRMGKLSWAFEKANTSVTVWWISFPLREFISELPTAIRDGAVTLKGSHRMGDGPIFLKTSASHSLMKSYRMDLLSARSIGLTVSLNIKNCSEPAKKLRKDLLPFLFYFHLSIIYNIFSFFSLYIFSL